MANKEYRKLHAEWYDLVSSNTDHSEEIEFWVRSIEESGEPVLELGSGTGRILIPLLERGYDITGIDTSKEMMDRCKKTCAEKGLKVDLYEKSMIDFGFPCKFNLIILGSGGLGLITKNEEIHLVFKQVMKHLNPGGMFIFEFEPVPVDEKNRIKTTGKVIG